MTRKRIGTRLMLKKGHVIQATWILLKRLVMITLRRPLEIYDNQ